MTKREVWPLTEKNDSVLDGLDESQIVGFMVVGGEMIIEECCDGYFRRRLSKEQVGRMIEELKVLHEQM